MVIRSVPLLADAVLPESTRGACAVLRAFFDESGIHAGSPVTVIAGFIGTRNQWRVVSRKWRKAMSGQTFHYKNKRMKGALLNKLASILCDSGLEVVGGGFIGNWERAIHSGAPDWPTRFPSSYHMVFEMTAQRMERISDKQWGGAPVAIMFSRQDEYAKRAEEVWRTFKGNGFWERMVSFGYGAPEQFVELQAADMIAYETFQCLKEESTGGWGWNKWPLVKILRQHKRTLHGFAQTEEKLVKLMKEQDAAGRRYLKTIDKPKRA